MAPKKKEPVESDNQSSIFTVTNIETQNSLIKDLNYNPKQLEPLKVINNVSTCNKKVKVGGLSQRKNTEVVAEPDTIYYLYFGEDESEYYSTEPPMFNGTEISIKSPIKKGTISSKVLNRTVTVEFNESGTVDQSKNSILTKSLVNDTEGGGVIIKCTTKQQLTWVGVSFEDAEQKMKDTKLEIYEVYETKLNNRANVPVNNQSMSEIQRFNTGAGNGRLLDL